LLATHLPSTRLPSTRLPATRLPAIVGTIATALEGKLKHQLFFFSFFYFEKAVFFDFLRCAAEIQKKRGVFMGCEKIGCLCF
jgi:hypothetical protein